MMSKFRRFDEKSLVLLIVLFFGWAPPYGFAEEKVPPSAKPAKPSASSKKAAIVDGDIKTRNFYEVLEDVLADFEYDLKNGEVGGLKDISVRNIATSENIPPSFKKHLELLITERIIKTTKTKVIQCLPCRSKTATLTKENVVISAPDSNPAELSRIAQMSGIVNFLDIAFAFQPTGLILSMHTTDAETGSIVWSRSYNSETSRAAAFRKGVDYSQVDEARRKTDYEPTVQYRVTTFYLMEKNITDYTGTLGLGFRMVERYDNRKKEVGFEIDYLTDATALVGTAPADGTSIYSSFNLTLLFIHSWNFIGEVENFNKVRGSIFTGIGGTYASGFLGGLVRAGYEWRLGKHWAVAATLGWRPEAAAFFNSAQVGTVSGFEFGVGISALF